VIHMLMNHGRPVVLPSFPDTELIRAFFPMEPRRETVVAAQGPII
jgi:hypothetical protein